MAAMMSTPNAPRITMFRMFRSRRGDRTADGACERIAAEMMSEMPLPRPPLVMSSPSHIMSIVPAVSVKTIRYYRLPSPRQDAAEACPCGKRAHATTDEQPVRVK
jgi:hypothetical protein